MLALLTALICHVASVSTSPPPSRATSRFRSIFPGNDGGGGRSLSLRNGGKNSGLAEYEYVKMRRNFRVPAKKPGISGERPGITGDLPGIQGIGGGVEPPIPLADLPESVGYFYHSGCHVYLQGTIHGSPGSAEEVRSLALHKKLKGRVKYIMLELDLDRYLYLNLRRTGTRRDKQKKAWDIFKRIVTDPDEHKKGEAILSLFLSSIMRAGESLEFQKGVDFLSAMDSAEELEVPVALADRSTNTTVERMFREFSIRSFPRHVSEIVPNLEFLTNTLRRGRYGRVSLQSALLRLPKAAQIFLISLFTLAVTSELPFDWNIAAKHTAALDDVASAEKLVLLYLAIVLPRVLKILFSERDVLMLSALENLADKLNNNNNQNKQIDHQDVIIGVVGLAHVNSMLNLYYDTNMREFASGGLGPVKLSENSIYDVVDFEEMRKPSRKWNP
eukprot:CAMPEP_0197533576 /NCGR_PEP_ID=MMETSP1318-20131121/43967_1 /TAXON_ID=552666 /ORGANISM="Partenskyella glossopodia, Strain RCC365" /LENGTH=444 /DNA_ID=CAMNT_0043090521 /DNA_START=151 /DNA_END=1485 /DNA_ORIENTATION=-